MKLKILCSIKEKETIKDEREKVCAGSGGLVNGVLVEELDRKVGQGKWVLIWFGLHGRIFLKDISSLVPLHLPLLFVTWIRLVVDFFFCFVFLLF